MVIEINCLTSKPLGITPETVNPKGFPAFLTVEAIVEMSLRWAGFIIRNLAQNPRENKRSTAKPKFQNTESKQNHGGDNRKDSPPTPG